MNLDQNILNTLKEYTSKITRKVELKVFDGENPKRPILIKMLQQVASLSDNIEVIYSETGVPVREGLSFELLAEGQKTGILFSGIPGGHEFNSFVLALLQAGGTPGKLDEALQRQIRAIDVDLHFETIISLECHVCPDVVQILNQFAVLNPKISHEMIDGGEHKGLIEERKVQGVPSIFLNKKPFANGKVTASEILEKIKDAYNVAEAEAVQDNTLYDVAVVGGGPAANAAAIYTVRKGLKVIQVAERFGGQVSDTIGIENMISVVQTTGPNLRGNMREHVQAYPVKIKEDVRVNSIESNDEEKRKLLHLSSGETLQAKVVIVATGAKWRELGVPGEKENVGNGVAYCPHCDGPFFEGKDVVVVGGGNSGVEAALDLAGIAKSVTVLEFMDELKADKVLVDKIETTSNVMAMTGIVTESIVADDNGVNGMNLLVRATGEKKFHATDGVFVQIGLVPNSIFVKEYLETNKFGEILVNSRCETNVEGVFACGDVTNVPYKQIIIAMGEGAKAGLSAFEFLLKKYKV